ncbi:hypothetical protein D3C81_2017220 [compost metagenome]
MLSTPDITYLGKLLLQQAQPVITLLNREAGELPLNNLCKVYQGPYIPELQQGEGFGGLNNRKAAAPQFNTNLLHVEGFIDGCGFVPEQKLR